MALSFKNDEKKDERLSPYSNSARDLYKQEHESIPGYDRENDGLDDHPVTGGDASGKSPYNDSRDDVESREQDAGNSINYTGTGQGGTKAKKPINFRTAVRDRGPVAVLIALLFGGGGAISVFFSGAILPIHIKEVFNEKFNDQLAVMDDQSMLLLKNKFKGKGAITGCTKISIRCKFNSLSDRQLKKMERSGQIKVNTSNETTLIRGRHKIESFEFKGKTVTADTLVKEARGDPEFRRALRKGYNPKLAGFADAVLLKTAKKIGFNKQKNLKGTTKKEFDLNVRKAVSGAGAAELDAKVTSSEEDCTKGSPGCDENGKRTSYKDSNGADLTKEQYDQRVQASSSFKAEIDARKSLSETSGKVAKSTLKGALTSTALGLGSIDNACTGYRLIRTVGFAAKYLGMLQLLRYFQVFANTGDVDKAGDGTPEANTYVGDKLTSVNKQGKSATDSYGYHYAAFGDTGGMPRNDDIKAEDNGKNGLKIEQSEQDRITANDEVTKYINGQLITSSVLASLIKFTGTGSSTKTADDKCKFVKSGWGQTIVIGAALIGAAIAFFTGGASLGWGIAVQTAATVAITIAIAMITPKLIDMAAGTMIDGNENGNQVGNALTSGAGAMNTQTFMGRGIPVLQKQDAVAYQEKTKAVMAQYAEEDRLEYGPFDPTHKNTFVGSVVARIIPYSTKMSKLNTVIPATVSLAASSLGNILPKANAQDNSAQFNVCQDRDYLDENMAADPFCNLRGGFTDEVSNIDSDQMLDYMISNNYINEETGEPKDSDNDYAKYIKDCNERTVPIGGYSETNSDTGTKCIQGRNGGDETKYNMFRKMSVLKGVNDGMDDGEVAKPAAAGSTNNTTATGDAKALAQQVADHPNISYVNQATKEQLKLFASGGQVVDSCGKPMTVSKHMLGAVLKNASKYKILVNNIGFKQDRDMCETLPRQHPAGTAIDLNNIEIIGGGSTGGSIQLPRGLDIVNQYATDFLAALPLNRGGVGQKDHGVNPTFPPGSVALNGTHLFPDAGNHLHIDARNRENLNDTE